MLWRQILCVTTRLESFPMGQWFRSSTGELQSVLRIVPGNFIAIKYFWCPRQESHSPESWNNRTPEASQYSPAKQQGPLCFPRKVGGSPRKEVGSCWSRTSFPGQLDRNVRIGRGNVVRRNLKNLFGFDYFDQCVFNF